MAIYDENYTEYDNYEDDTEAAYDGAMTTIDNADGNEGEFLTCKF